MIGLTRRGGGTSCGEGTPDDPGATAAAAAAAVDLTFSIPAPARPDASDRDGVVSDGQVVRDGGDGYSG